VSRARSPESWSQLSSLIDVLLDAAPEQRATLIAELSGGEPARHAELERLVEDCERESPLLERPAAERFAALLDAQPATFPEVLAERYRLTRELGRGGMATVYLSRDMKHGRDVAVKVMHPIVAATLGAERFLREIQIVAQLHHPHVVALYDSGEAEGALFYVMPYETGPSLRHRLARDGALSPDEVVVILRDVCDALAHAHARGIVHRDVKPDNVLLSGAHALVTDFGIAKALSESLATAPILSDGRATDLTSGAALGTPTYMAPEQIAGEEEIDHRADIYAVGVLGYELLTGRPPFTGDTRQAILGAHLRDVPPPLAVKAPDAPPPLVDLVMRCLEKRREDRWQSTAGMVQMLESFAATWSRPATFGFRSRWSLMRIERLTDFPGSEVDAAISADGRHVAFLSDRDGVFDAFVTELGSGQFTNLTNGRLGDLFNEEVRNVGFTHDGTHVWIRVADLTSRASVSLVPISGGALRPFLDTAVSAAWSSDGSRLAYHELTPGDPIFVAGPDGRDARRIYIAPPGLHSHYPTWSPDGRFVYFSHGLPLNEMDVWRIPFTGGCPERMTSHNSRVAFPVLVDDRTLLYTATDDDGGGPWLYMMDVEERTPNRLTTGVEHFVSIAASAEVAGQPRRLVATVSNPTTQLWRVPLTDGIAGEASARRVALPTARSAAPRFAPDSSLLYLAARGGVDGLWRLSPAGARELWKPTEGAIAGAAAISPNDGSVCFATRRRGRGMLRCVNADGSGVRTLAESLDVQGAPSWSPDGKWIAIAARDGQATRVFKVPVDGGRPVPLIDSVSFNPVWSPDGTFIVYSDTPRGRSVAVRAVRHDGAAVPLPFASLLVDRVADSYRFLPSGRGLVVKLGGFRRQDFWLFDLETGDRRQLTSLEPGESVRRFDVSPDSKDIVFERVRENSDIAVIDVPTQ
jgi:serine/threonine protein kinase